MQVWINGAPGKKIRLDAPDGFHPLANGLDAGEHTVVVVRVAEGFLGLTHFRGFALDHSAKALPWGPTPDHRIEFIGDSITCGYGVGLYDPSLHFDPATEIFDLGCSGLTARPRDRLSRRDAFRHRDGAQLRRTVDGNPDAMPKVYPQTFYVDPKLRWDFSRFSPDVICLNLGTNDFSTKGVNGEKLRTALQTVIRGLSGEEAKRVHFLALSPQGSVGFGADYHPNRAQSKINAAELTAFLRDLMNWR